MANGWASAALYFSVLLFVFILSFSAFVYAVSMQNTDTNRQRQVNALCKTLENKELIETSGLVWTEKGWFSGDFGMIIAPQTGDAVAIGYSRQCGGFEVS